MKSVEPFPLVDLSGSPRERGLAYGAAAKERIDRSIALYRGQLRAAGYDPGGLAGLSQDFRKRVGDWAPEMLEEMDAIAEGAGVDAVDILLINARTELVQLAKRKVAANASEPDGCTGVVVLPEASATG